MTDRIQLLARLAAIDIEPSAEHFQELTELIQLRVSVGASSSVSVPLTGISSPKVLVVRGAKSVVAQLNDEDSRQHCYPLYVESNLDGRAVTSLVIYNDDTKAHDVYIWAAA